MAKTSHPSAPPPTSGVRGPRAFGHLLGIVFDSQTRLQHGERFLTLMAGDSFEAILAAFEADPDGRALLRARPDTTALLANRADLARRPVGSFGRCYLEFLVPNGFDDADIMELARRGSADPGGDPRRTWLRNRIDGGHDVRHVLAGYGGDLVGEVCLLAFRAAQVRHPGVAVLAVGGAAVSLVTRGLAGLKAVTEAYRRGRDSVLIDLCAFEFDLSEPLESCGARLGLTPPRAYQALVEARSRPAAGRLAPAKVAAQESSA